MALFAVFLTSLNSYNLVLVFVYRQKDVRLAVRQFLTCSYPRKQSVAPVSMSDPGRGARTLMQKQFSIRLLSQGQAPANSVQPPSLLQQRSTAVV